MQEAALGSEKCLQPVLSKACCRLSHRRRFGFLDSGLTYCSENLITGLNPSVLMSKPKKYLNRMKMNLSNLDLNYSKTLKLMTGGKILQYFCYFSKVSTCLSG